MNAHYIPERKSLGVFTDHILTNGWPITGNWQDPHEVSTDQNFAIGTRLILGDQSFRYGKFHTAVAEMSYALVNGNVIPTDGAEVAILAGSAIGDHTITVLDTTVRAVNYYQGGYVYFYRSGTETATNHDQLRRIIASTAGAGTSVTLTLDYPLTCIPIATCDVYPSQYSRIGTAGHFSSGNEMFVGYASAMHAAGGFGWVQTWGPVNGHYTGGATEWPGNHGPNDRQVIFSVEGGLRTTKSSGTVVPLASQIAGYALPCTAADYGSVFVYLTIAP
jgi:hypothetical protein